MVLCLTPEQEELRKIVLAERLARKRASNPHKPKQGLEPASRDDSDEEPIVVLPARRATAYRQRAGKPSLASQVEEAAARLSIRGLPTDVEHVAVQLGTSWTGTKRQLSTALAALRHRGRVAQLPPGYGQGRGRKAKTAS